MLAPIGRLMIGAGALLVVAGFAVTLIARLGLSRLPGDLFIQRGRFTFYFPIVTCLILSVVLSLVMSIIARWRR
jgi:hypothetical protein